MILRNVHITEELSDNTTVVSMAEHVYADGTNNVISATDSDLYLGVDTPVSIKPSGYTVSDGLSSSRFNPFEVVFQDKYGFMWFGTDNGLARYDGYDFKIYPITDDSNPGTQNQIINKVFEDADGNLWIGTAEHGLQLFDRIKESFTCFLNNPDDQNSLSHNTVNIIYQDRHHVLWVGTNDGLNKFDPGTRNFNAYKQNFEKTDSLKNHISTLYEDSRGTFWIGTWNGLYRFDRKNGDFTSTELAEDIPEGFYRRITCIIEDRDNVLWIGSLWGMFKYDIHSKKIVNYLPRELSHSSDNRKASLSNLFVESIVETELNSKHILWIATKWGLNKFDIDMGRTEEIYENHSNPNGLSTNFLKELYLDNTGLLWIGTKTSGVEILNTTTNLFHPVLMKNPDDEFSYQASSFLWDNNERLWVGATDGGLFQYDHNFRLVGNYRHFSFDPDNFDRRNNNRITCIHNKSDKSLLLGFYEWGLVNFDKQQKTFLQIKLLNNADTQKPITIDNILLDHYGMLWIGTNAGVYIKNENIDSPAHIIRHEVLNNAEIKSIFEDRKGNLWISTLNNGLYSLRPENRSSMDFINYRNDKDDRNGFWGNDGSAFYEDRKGTLWFGTDKGLNRFNPLKNSFEPDTSFNKHYEGFIIRIYGDSYDNLWLFHSSQGLIRYQPYTDNKNKVKVFDTKDGLPFEDFNTIFSFYNSFYQSDDGRLFLSAGVGTGYSFFWFHPDSIKDNCHIPKMAITHFNVGNKNFAPDSTTNVKRHIVLNYNENFFSFEFAALDYLIPGKNQYAFYLDGYEDGWIYAGNRRLANYTGVPPGEYTFRVKGSNNDGYWNEEGTSVHLSILPPFWLTWWAYIIYGLVTIAIMYTIVHYYLRRQRLLQNLAIEQFETEKLKELDSLKTKFFANISHEFRTPLTLILGPVQQLISKIKIKQDKQALSMVLNNANRLKGLVNQLLDLSKLESGKMKLKAAERDVIPLVREYVQSFESLAKQKDIELTFASGKDSIPLWVDKEKLQQILFNLMSNAFKFTDDGGEIVVEVTPLPLSMGDKGTPPLSGGDNSATELSPLEGGRGVMISISDTGHGIPPEKLPHIFDRFYQADDSVSREQEGTGIGLAIVKEMVNLHHGTIEVKSKPGKGTAFMISLPLGKGHLLPDEILKAEEQNDEIVDYSNTRPSIISNDTTNIKEAIRLPDDEIESRAKLLIVDDNADMRSFIRAYFERDYQVIESGDGRAGLKIAGDHIPDIIISDVMMPKMDGYEFCQHLKTDEKTCHIPVILLTARASKESRLEGLETGADDFVTKPFDGEELQVRVKNLIDQRKKLSHHYRKDFEVIQTTSEDKLLSMDEKFLGKAKEMVEKSLSNPEYGVENFASDMALSRYQLHRKLSALVNQSATEFIRILRLNFAIGLLKKRAGNISEIAYDAGFNNPTYFSISFKKQFGLSPTEYLNQLDQAKQTTQHD